MNPMAARTTTAMGLWKAVRLAKSTTSAIARTRRPEAMTVQRRDGNDEASGNNPPDGGRNLQLSAGEVPKAVEGPPTGQPSTTAVATLGSPSL